MRGGLRRGLRSAAPLLAAAALAIGGIGARDADPTASIGTINQTELNAAPAFAKAQATLADYKRTLDAQFAEAVKSTSGTEAQQKLADSFAQKFTDRQHALLDPLVTRAQAAIASVASSRSLSVVVDRRIVIVGGNDITNDVMTLFNGPSAPVPPASTPTNSPVGYVDQRSIDAVPSVKAANDTYLAYQRSAQAKARAALASAKDAAARTAIIVQAQSDDAAEQHKVLDPIVERTRDAMAQIAAKRGLALVVDRAALLYGGTDVTNDVQAALK